MKAEIKWSTIRRLEENTKRPISRGVDKAITICLDQLDDLKQTSKRSEKK